MRRIYLIISSMVVVFAGVLLLGTPTPPKVKVASIWASATQSLVPMRCLPPAPMAYSLLISETVQPRA